MAYSYDRTAAETLPSLEGVAKKWGQEILEAVLKAVPKRYKQDKGEIRAGVSSGYAEVVCKGTSVRDLDVELTVGFIVDAFRGEVVGQVTWEEVGFRRQEAEIRLRADKSGSAIVDQVLQVVAANERG